MLQKACHVGRLALWIELLGVLELLVVDQILYTNEVCHLVAISLTSSRKAIKLRDVRKLEHLLPILKRLVIQIVVLGSLVIIRLLIHLLLRFFAALKIVGWHRLCPAQLQLPALPATL